MADLWYGAASDEAMPARDATLRPWAGSRAFEFVAARWWPVAVYAGSRLVILGLVLVVAAVSHRSVAAEVSAFDGQWYVKLAAHGYPSHVTHGQSTLGFFPLYSIVIRLVARILASSLVVAGVVVSLAGGLVATVLVQQMAGSWWGEAVGRRASLIFAFFPGSIVFSMLYSECLAIPLALGCVLALRARRWAVAGLLAGLATAVEPVAIVLGIVCAVAAVREIRAHGLRSRSARLSLAAPLLSPVGIGAFAAFLWLWTGTPFAALTTQHYGWYEQSEPLGILGTPVARHLMAHPASVVAYLPSWNLWNAIAGGVVLALSLVALWRVRSELPGEVLAWAIAVAAMTLWSVMTPPNARMLLFAVPVVVVWARRVRLRQLPYFVAGEMALFVLMSVLTLSGHMLP